MERNISTLEREIAELRKTLAAKENELYELKKKWVSKPQIDNEIPYNTNGLQNQTHVDRLPRWAIERYSRQILLPEIGVAGQEALLAARVLIVGAGGLGCPAAAYLAGAGVGEISIIDYDTVDITNIHRQLLHAESDQSISKVESAANALRRINSNIKIRPYLSQLTSSNALGVLRDHHLVLDCSDNVPTRYLLNDACVRTKIPLISGSALKMEGQLTIYGYRGTLNTNGKEQDPLQAESHSGPCYRCLFPAPPPAGAAGSCSANGVAGPVPGLIGALQALEAIKMIVGHPHSKLLVERMLIFDGEDCTFRTVRLRPRNQECAVCGENPTITSLVDYEQFCNAKAKEKDLDLDILPPSHRIVATELAEQLSRSLLVDVRSAPEFAMCRIEGAVNYPIDSLHGTKLDSLVESIRNTDVPVTFVCRRGNDSQIAAQRVLDALNPRSESDPRCGLNPLGESDTQGGVHAARIRDLVGGLHSWSKHVDNNFPVY